MLCKSILSSALFCFITRLVIAGTQIVGPIKVPFTGDMFNGILVINAPTMILPDGSIATAGAKTIPVVNGVIDPTHGSVVTLEPNDTATPAGTSYRVQYVPTVGVSYPRFWVVSTSGTPLKVSQVETSTVVAPGFAIPPAQLSNPGGVKGDILVWTGTAWLRLPAGNDGQVLTVSQAQATGLRYTTPSGGATYLSLPFSSTPVFDWSLATTYKMPVTGPVTDQTFPNVPAGQTISLILCQDATGNRPWTWATRVHGVTGIGQTANKCSTYRFLSDGDNLYLDGVANINQ